MLVKAFRFLPLLQLPHCHQLMLVLSSVPKEVVPFMVPLHSNKGTKVVPWLKVLKVLNKVSKEALPTKVVNKVSLVHNKATRVVALLVIRRIKAAKGLQVAHVHPTRCVPDAPSTTVLTINGANAVLNSNTAVLLRQLRMSVPQRK